MGIAWNDISKEQRDSIVKLCIEHVEENHNCRIGWAAKEVLGADVQPNVLDKLAARIVEGNKYIKEPANFLFEAKGDWNIRKNPLYRWKDKYPFLFESSVVLVSVILSTIVTLLISRKSTDTKSQSDEYQKNSLKTSGESKDSVKLLKDTLFTTDSLHPNKKIKL